MREGLSSARLTSGYSVTDIARLLQVTPCPTYGRTAVVTRCWETPGGCRYSCADHWKNFFLHKK